VARASIAAKFAPYSDWATPPEGGSPVESSTSEDTGPSPDNSSGGPNEKSGTSCDGTKSHKKCQ